VALALASHLLTPHQSHEALSSRMAGRGFFSKGISDGVAFFHFFYQHALRTAVGFMVVSAGMVPRETIKD